MTSIARVTAGLVTAGLLALTTACGGAASSGGEVAKPGGEVAKPPAQKVDATVAGKGMKGGCEAVKKAFAAIEAGDMTTANSLRDKGATLFDDVAAENATTDLDLATDGAKMGSELDYELPTDPTKYRSDLATQYASICVAKYQAAALEG
ncbi:hypothetical protein KOI35_30580 [Actinoplanes bogorensis]|uniref:Lipoprotein n=1 Tax=Paractinoplanes bogorensis TaxID=1610840 RepID=A0ABS5YWQ4_9ACTN|nr:hypothetical protein [Actinoplanes bogorensis]MBU2667867.1 hypothetical protein [Actinoplanes bogorensis]